MATVGGDGQPSAERRRAIDARMHPPESPRAHGRTRVQLIWLLALTIYTVGIILGATALTVSTAALVDTIPRGDTGSVDDLGLAILRMAAPLALSAALISVILSATGWLLWMRRVPTPPIARTET